MPLAWCVQFVLLVCVAKADVELDMGARVVRFVVRDRSQVSSCVGRTPTFFCRRGCGGRGGGLGGGGGAVWPTGQLTRADASCVWGAVAALRVGTPRRTWHVTTISSC